MSSRRIFNDTGTRRYAASGSIATQPLPGSTASSCATCQRASAPLRALWSSRSAQTAFLHSRTRSAHWSHGLRSTPSMGRWGRDRTCGRRQRSGTPPTTARPVQSLMPSNRRHGATVGQPALLADQMQYC